MPSLKHKHVFQVSKQNYDLSFIANLKNFALAGEHNRKNALGASLLALSLGVSPKRIAKALQCFPGVARRQQIRFEGLLKEGNSAYAMTFIEDFAHHPEALRASIAGTRELFPQRRLHIFFEPRSASSHSKLYQVAYRKALAKADRIYLCEVFNRKKLVARDLLQVRDLVYSLNEQTTASPRAFYGRNPQILLKSFQKNFKPCKKGDVLLALSNGNFGGIYPRINSFLKGLA